MKLRRVLLFLACLLLLTVFTAGEAAAAEEVEYVTYQEAVDQVRAAMVARHEIITVYVRSETDLGNSACYELYDLAMAHTGVPYEGDYIRRNMSGCYYNTEATIVDGVYYYTFTLTPNWLATAEQEGEVDAAVDALLNELALWDASNYEKITGVYNWVTENVQYDFDNLDDDSYMLKYSTYSAIVQRNTVCQGYATLVYRLLLSLDVDCRLISGYADGENHAWNIVYLDGKYYNVDATWDRDLMGHYRYFLCTEENFGDHTRDSEFDTADFHARYPMAIVPYVFNVTASGTVNANIAWVLDGDTGTLTVAGTGAIPSYRYNYAPWYSYRESVKSIVVSEGITEVGERAFYWCTNCTSVTLPSSLIAIREYGFNNLRALQYITLPENLQIIEFCAFSECAALKSITLPDSVHTVGPSAFSNCPALTSATLSAGMTRVPNSMFFNDTRLRTVVIPEGITAIGDTAFSGCALSSFHFPATLVTLGSSVFGDCSSLSAYTVAEGNPSFKAMNGVLFTADGKTLLSYPGAKYGSYTVPEGTEYIASSAFRGSRISGIDFGTTLKEIGRYSFSYCTNLYSVTFPANVTKICDSAFRSCTYLRNIYFQNNSVTIESGGVFAECDSLVSITLPTNLSEIPGYLFYGCAKLNNVTIPDTAARIGSSAFLDCDSLVSITVPGSVKSIGQQAFDFCNKLETIILEEGVQTLGWISIRNCPALKKVVLPDSLKTIEHPYNASSRMFDNCPNLVLYVNCGSYGDNYAIDNHISRFITHTYTVTQVISPTCTAQGYTQHSCHCGWRVTTEDYVAALGHDYTSEVTPPTCTEWGYTTYTCTRCLEWFEDYFVEPTGHSWGDWHIVQDAVCETDGMEERACTVCGFFEGRAIPAPGHNWGEWYQVTAPTCTAEGMDQRECLECGESEARDTDPAGHSYESVITAPTCTEQGYTTYTCSVCGDSYAADFVDTLNHDYLVSITYPAGIVAGCTDYTCSRCGDTYRTSWLIETAYEGMTIACVGDSITAGVGVTKDETDYVTLLADQLGMEYIRLGVSGTTLCTDGSRTCNIGKLTEANLQGADVVTIAMGINDFCAAGEGYYELGDINSTDSSTIYGAARMWCERIEELRKTDSLNHTQFYFVTPVITSWNNSVTSARDWDQSKTNIHGYTLRDLCNAIIEVAALYDVAVIDLNLLSGMYYVDAQDNNTAVFGGDGVHPGEKGHEMMEGAIADVLLQNDLRDDHAHTFGSWITTTWPTCLAGEAQRVCAVCSAAECRTVESNGHHRYHAVVTEPSCAGQGYTTHTCTICGESYVDSYVEPTGEHIYEDGICTGCGTHLPGDITGDGEVDNKDLTRLFRYLSDYDVEVVEAALDVNGDGEVNNKDLTRLFRHLSGWDVEMH